MNRIFILYLFLFLSSITYSQTNNERNSFYISTKGDTIYGAVYKVHNTFFYKKSKDAREKQKLNNDSIKGFKLVGGIGFDKKEITTTKSGKLETINVFAKTIITGPCSLYSIIRPSNDDEDLAFCVEKNCKSYILSQSTSSNINIPNPDTRYLTMLQYLLGDCDSVKKLIPDVLFEEISLAWIIRSYNSCIAIKNKTDNFTCKPEEKIDINLKPKEIPLEHFNKRVLYVTQASLLSDKSGEDDSTTYKNNFAMGFGFNYFSLKPKVCRIFSFSLGLQCMYFKYTINTNNFYGLLKMPIQKLIVDMPVTLNVQIIHKTDFTIYVSEGFDFNYSRILKISNSEIYYPKGHVELRSKFSPENKSHFNVAYITGIGCVFKQLFLQVSLNTTPVLMYISLGYSF